MPPPRRLRLDLFLVERGLFPTRAKAQAALMAGKVRLAGRPAAKAGTLVPPDAEVEVLPEAVPFVSRGGLKLRAALDVFGLRPAGRVCLDLGASTGGFTDCLLQRGAARVYAVDVGRAQLDSGLRSDPRVVNLERTHVRALHAGMFPESPDLAVIDVSFISLTQVLAHVVPCLRRPFEILALVKPQFEVGPKLAPKGVVRREEARLEAVERVLAAARGLGLEERGRLPSPVKGAKGNVEVFVYLTERP